MTVTAIVSAYFADKWLDRRIQNLLEQEPKPEVIVVCEDNSKEDLIASCYQDIKIIRTYDVPTIYEAWNMAIEAASGELITNANCDDLLLPGALAEMEKAFKAHVDCSVVYSDVNIVNLTGEQIGRFTWQEGGLRELMHGCFIGPMPMWKRKLHDKYGLFDAAFTVAGDYEFWMRLAAGGERFYHIPRPLGNYMKRDDSAEHRQNIRTIWETARARGRYREAAWLM